MSNPSLARVARGIVFASLLFGEGVRQGNAADTVDFESAARIWDNFTAFLAAEFAGE